MADLEPPFGAVPEGSEQILRVDQTPDRSLVVTLNPEAFDGPSTWGMLLVDIAHHVADAGEQLGMTREESLAEIWELFNAEWQNRTDRTEPYRPGPKLVV